MARGRGWSKRELRSWTMWANELSCSPTPPQFLLLYACCLSIWPFLLLPLFLLLACAMFRVSCFVTFAFWVGAESVCCGSWGAGRYGDGWLVVGETIACSRKHEILIMFIMPKGFVSRRCTHTALVLARAVRGVASSRRIYKTRLIFIFTFIYCR